MCDTPPALVLDRAELAWAAGFFDGEGSTIARTLTSRPGYYQLNVTVPQAGRDGIPPVLMKRFNWSSSSCGRTSARSSVLKRVARWSWWSINTRAATAADSPHVGVRPRCRRFRTERPAI